MPKVTGKVATLSIGGKLIERGEDGTFEVPFEALQELKGHGLIEVTAPPAASPVPAKPVAAAAPAEAKPAEAAEKQAAPAAPEKKPRKP